jgi:hypothetical protein
MSVIITITFDVDIDKSSAAAEAIPEVMNKIGEANARHGGKALMVLKRDGAFMDINEYPDADAYAAFKADAQDAIAEFEAKAGLTSQDHVWDIVSNELES